jgi:hypothetical protein
MEPGQFRWWFLGRVLREIGGLCAVRLKRYHAEVAEDAENSNRADWPEADRSWLQQKSFSWLFSFWLGPSA